MPTYFHIAPMLLAPDTLLLPGNFGRIIRHPRRAQDASYRREIAMEEQRALHFREKPSRLNCVFGLTSRAAVRAYRQIGSNFFSTVYEIEPVTGAEVVHIGCWRIGLIEQGRYDLIKPYWRGLRVDRLSASGKAVRIRVKPEDEFAEILIGGEARIIRRLDEDELK